MAKSICSNLINKNDQLVWDIFACDIFEYYFYFFEHRREANDDVAVSMVTHGYGIAAVGTLNLIFSNVVWDHLVKAIPKINSVLGYSIAAFGMRIVLGAVVFSVFIKLGFGRVLSLFMQIFFCKTYSFSAIHNQ